MPRRSASRTSDPDPDLESADREEEESGGAACLPRLFFLLLVVLLTALLAVEIRTGLKNPSVLRVTGPPPAPTLTFYQTGHASAREAWLFDEPKGTSGPPRLIARLDLRPRQDRIGEIRWTADGGAVYAAGRSRLPSGTPEVLWLFEFSPSRLYLLEEVVPPPGRSVYIDSPAGLTKRWRQHGGAGSVAVKGYELGAKGPRMYSWQITRWEKAIKSVPP